MDLSSDFHPVPKVFRKNKPPKRINRIGKKGKASLEANIALKKTFQEIGVFGCEIRLEGCWKILMNYAHGKKRRDLSPEELKTFAIGACTPCHDKIEYFCMKWTGQTMEDFVRGVIAKRGK